MRIRFDSKKEKMYGFLKLMKDEVQTAMERALEAIEKQDPKMARKVLEHDVYLDRYRYQLEDYCGTIIATQSPVASELKELLVGIKLAGIFERMGDHACHLVQTLDEKTNYAYLEQFVASFKEMITIGNSMLNGVMEAYFSSDLPRLKLIRDEDDDIDAIYDKNYEAVVGLLENNPKDVRELLKIIDISKSLERYGDYAASIGEWLYFARTSEHIDFTDFEE